MQNLLKQLCQWFNGPVMTSGVVNDVPEPSLTEAEAMNIMAAFTRGEQVDLDSFLESCVLTQVNYAEAIRAHNHANRDCLGLSGRRAPTKAA